MTVSNAPLHRHFLLPLSVALALALAACAGGGPDDERAPPAASDVAADAAEDAAHDDAHAPDGAQPPEVTGEDGAGMAPGEPVDPQMWMAAAQMGGSLQALVEACGRDGGAGLAEMPADARSRLEAMGTDMAQFESVWNQAQAEAKREIDAGSPAQLAEACGQLEQMEAMAEQMEAQQP